MSFKPEEHFRNLKGQQYLEVKWRVVWFREEHSDGYVRTELVEHDPAGGLAVFKAQVGYLLPDGKDVYATGYGSETRKDFGDYLEKSETKAIGRALAMLGYGTQFAIELDEGEKGGSPAIADSPVERKPATTTDRQTAPQNGDYQAKNDQMTADAQEEAARREYGAKLLAHDPEAQAIFKQRKTSLAEQHGPILVDTVAWLERRASEALKAETAGVSA